MSEKTSKCIVAINLGNFGSTGTIMKGISEAAEDEGYVTFRAYPEQVLNQPRQNRDIIIINKLFLRISKKMSYITGYNGCFAIIPTLIFLHKLNRIKPDIIHLHNLHNSYINVPLLFNFIKRKRIKVIWTLHDCWGFTGKCPHFTLEKCQKWKNGCGNCCQIDAYPAAKKDRTNTMWKLKKQCFTSVRDMTIVTPSQWLADLVKQSYLHEFPVTVINNGIDLNIFKPIKSEFRSKYNAENKYILLGVAFDWSKRKGLDVFINLSKRLDDRFQIVLVGTNDEINKQLPEKIISICKTHSQRELAEIYTAADLFINPTREENYPTVNMESIACGTPVLTFKTGGSPEIVDEKTGYVVEVDDIDELEKQIIRICTEKSFSKRECLKKSKTFDKKLKFKEYIKLYK